MKSIREIMRDNKDIRSVAQMAKEKFIAKGYIHSEVYGWINPEDVEKFGLDPNANAIPAEEYDEVDYKEVTTEEKDAYGRKNGNKFVEKVPFKTGKKIWSASSRFLGYQGFKDLEDKKAYAKFKDLERLSENY